MCLHELIEIKYRQQSSSWLKQIIFYVWTQNLRKCLLFTVLYSIYIDKCVFCSHWTLTMIPLILLLHKTELLEPLLLWHGLIDEGACLLVWLTPSAADHAIDSTVQDVEALLGNQHVLHVSCFSYSWCVEVTMYWTYSTCSPCETR